MILSILLRKFIRFSFTNQFHPHYSPTFSFYVQRAAGKGGPDFFIDTYQREATWWNTDHTVWGEVADKESMDIIMGMYKLPATKKSLTYLDKPVPINISSP